PTAWARRPTWAAGTTSQRTCAGTRSTLRPPGTTTPEDRDMPANTPKGFPYPLGTDRLMDGDDAIHNLATAVDTLTGVFASGTVNTPVPGALNPVVSVAVTFPVGRFTAPPQVSVCAIASSSI